VPEEEEEEEEEERSDWALMKRGCMSM